MTLAPDDSDRPGQSDCFAGRGEELTSLRNAVAALRSRRQVVVEITGEPGIGKTRLVDEALSPYRRRGLTWAAGSGAEAEQRVPFHVFRNALAGVSSPVDDRDDGDSHQSGWSDRLAGDADPTDQIDPRRFRTYQSLARRLGHHARDGLALVLDDLHWADPQTWGLIRHLVRYPVAAPLLLVLVYRPRQVASRLDRDGSSAVRRIQLGPLSVAESARLLDMRPAPAELARLHAQAGGNPLYLLAHSGWLRRGGGNRGSRGADPADPARSGVAAPPGASRAAAALIRIQAEIAELPVVAATVLTAAAVLGDPFDGDLLAAVADLPPPQVQAAVVELSCRDLIRPAGDTTDFAFRHPVLGWCAFGQADAGWRVAAHRRAADELARRGAPAAIRAAHVAKVLRANRAPARPDEVEVLLSAAEAIDVAPRDAADWLRLATDAGRPGPTQTADPGTARRQRQIAFLRARAIGLAGQLAESRVLLHDVLHTVPRSDTNRADMIAFSSRVEWLLGNYAEADALLSHELDEVPSGHDPGELARLAAAYGSVAILTNRTRAAVAVIDTVASLVSPQAEEPVWLTMAAVRGLAEIHDGRVPAAREGLASVTPVIDRLPDTDLIDHPDCLAATGLTELFLERHRDAARHFDRGIALSSRAGRDDALPQFMLGRCQVAIHTGDLATAIRLARESGAAAARIGSRDLHCIALGFQAQATAWAGGPQDGPDAVRLARQAARVASDSGGWYGRTAAVSLGTALYAAGDPQACIDVLLQVGRDRRLSALQTSMRPRWFHLLTTAALEMRDLTAAALWADRTRSAADRLGLTGQAGFAAAALGQVLLARGEPGPAVGHLAAAAECFRHAEMSLFEGLVSAYSVSAHALLGHPEQAARAGRRAGRLAQQCGSALIGNVLDERVDRPAPPVMADSGGGASVEAGTLTRREQQIAQQAATGATTRSIGRTLGISPRTVEAHLSRIYRKLGLPSRASLAAFVVRADDRSDARTAPTAHQPR
ncbi:AAA family ATPase [Solwaraspora sp. WMMD937]|uniref:helix-turn-helix transcriptional regulator n=1 Tax=Solwaraspora sp. WMMD937 TaxID=3016090 RepID=UPI00249C66BA|nr:helix-turn-helix transcriptional regulator [Solwaraspora sp. WMMD937]WFE22206.1 AAA family ATPase [Solwaraspora sp. WMMD937]